MLLGQKFRFSFIRFLLVAALLGVASVRAEHEGKVQILLLGDSTTEGKIPRLLAPGEPQLEDIIRILLAAEADLPPSQVINLGASGESIRSLLHSGRYDREVAHLPGLDFILVRYGLNDEANNPNFESDYPIAFHDLLARLRKDHPGAVVIPMTMIPMTENVGEDAVRDERIDGAVERVATEEHLPVLDILPRYIAELAKGPNMLCYRRYPLSKIPEKYRALAKPYVVEGKESEVIVLDNRLDAHFGGLERWHADRHPNLAGYHVIADETVKFLAPLIRQRLKRPTP